MKDIDKNAETCRFKERQEAPRKLGADENSSKTNTVRWQTASFLEVCSPPVKSTRASDVLYGGVNCLFNSESA